MKELDLQSEYVMDFFCRRADGLGFQEVKNNRVTSDLFIADDLLRFFKENSPKPWQNLLRKNKYAGDEQALLRDIMAHIRERIETYANVAIFLNSNRRITFEGETLQLIYVSGTELNEDEDFERNIFSAVEEVSYSFEYEGRKVFRFRPDLSFFINGIFLGYSELKSNFNNQTAKTQGRNKIIADYLEAVYEYTKIAAGNDVTFSLRRRMLRPFEKSIHLVSTDIYDTYVLRNVGQFTEEVKKGFQDNLISISSFRPVIEEVFKPLPTVAGPDADPRVRFEEAMRSLYSKKMIEKEILYYNFMAYSYKTVTKIVDGHKVQEKEYKDKTGRLICPRPKQKFGCDRIMVRVQEYLDHEKDPNYFINKLRDELTAMGAAPDIIERIVSERDSYCNNKYVYSLLLQYAAGFGKSNIIGWTALQLKDLRHEGRWVYDKILLVVDRLQLRDQLDSMMLNMNIDKAMFVEATDQDTFVKALSDKRRIIVVNIQKFWELKNAIEKAGKNFTDKRVAFLIDEVHRSNTEEVHEEMLSTFDEIQDIFDKDGGKICKGSTNKNLIIGFTATPSERVLARFGEFYRGSNFNQIWKPFDSYTMAEAIADGYILDPIKHIIPVPTKMYFELPDGLLELITEAIKSGREDKVSIAKKAVYENRDRMKAISEWIVKRLLTLVYGKIRGQGKAMLAVSSIPIAIDYCRTIRRIMTEKTESGPFAKYASAPVSIVYSDDQRYEKCSLMNDGKSEEKVIEEFKTAKNGLIIVVAKLQTGFDEPKLHTLFLDKEINDINAIQTISRVNRTTKYKEECHIVDFSFRNVNVKNIKAAYEKFCHTVISDFDPTQKKVELEGIYEGLIRQILYSKWFDKYRESLEDKEGNVRLCQDMDADFRAWILQAEFAFEKLLEELGDDKTGEEIDAARELKDNISRYFTLLGEINGVIEIDDKYRDKVFIDFWQRYNNIYNSMHQTGVLLGSVTATYDGEIGLVISEEVEVVPPPEPPKLGAPKSKRGQGMSLEEILGQVIRLNIGEEEKAKEMKYWKEQTESLYDFLRDNQSFMAKLTDDNFSREQIEKEYHKLLRKFLRQTTDERLKKLIDDNKETFLEEFRRRQYIREENHNPYGDWDFAEPNILMAAEDYEVYGHMDVTGRGYRESLKDKTVLVGCFKSPEHKGWITDNALYNIRLGERHGSMSSESRHFNEASVLVLYDVENPSDVRTFTLSNPREISGNDMIVLEYPGTSSEKIYEVFDVTPTDDIDPEEAIRLVDGVISQPGHEPGMPAFITPDQ